MGSSSQLEKKIQSARKRATYEERLAAMDNLLLLRKTRDLYTLFTQRDDLSFAEHLLTPFQQWFWTIADSSVKGYPRILAISFDQVSRRTTFPIDPNPDKIYAIPTFFPDQYYVVLQGKFKFPMVLYNNILYYSFNDDCPRLTIPEPEKAQQKNGRQSRLEYLSVRDLPDRALQTLYAMDDDYFVYTPSKRAFRNYKIREYPSLLGNFVAAEKLHYHSILTSHGLMHPSTKVYYGQDVFHLLTRYPQKSILQQTYPGDVVQRMGFGGEISNKVMKLPFSSSSHSIERIPHRQKLFKDPFFEYGCIIQDFNLVHRNDRIKEIRCMVVDGQIVCGCMVSTFQGTQYQIRLFETDRNNRFVRSPCVDLFLRKFQKGTQYVSSLIKGKEAYLPYAHPLARPRQSATIEKLKKEIENRHHFVKFVTDFIQLLEDQFVTLGRIVEKTFQVFNAISIGKPLPTTLESFRLQQQQASQERVRIFQSVRKSRAVDVIPRAGAAEQQLSNKICIERFLANPVNYLNRRFHERFLRIDLMYWPLEDRFYVNEVETYACGKFAKETDGFFNHSIYSLIHARMIAPDVRLIDMRRLLTQQEPKI